MPQQFNTTLITDPVELWATQFAPNSEYALDNDIDLTTVHWENLADWLSENAPYNKRALVRSGDMAFVCTADNNSNSPMSLDGWTMMYNNASDGGMSAGNLYGGLDGQGHSIKNYQRLDCTDFGLFNFTGGVFKNIFFEDINIRSLSYAESDMHRGVICNTPGDSVRFQNIKVTGNIEAANSLHKIGCLSGTQVPVIMDCLVDVTASGPGEVAAFYSRADMYKSYKAYAFNCVSVRLPFINTNDRTGDDGCNSIDSYYNSDLTISPSGTPLTTAQLKLIDSYNQNYDSYSSSEIIGTTPNTRTVLKNYNGTPKWFLEIPCTGNPTTVTNLKDGSIDPGYSLGNPNNRAYLVEYDSVLRQGFIYIGDDTITGDNGDSNNIQLNIQYDTQIMTGEWDFEDVWAMGQSYPELRSLLSEPSVSKAVAYIRKLVFSQTGVGFAFRQGGNL